MTWAVYWEPAERLFGGNDDVRPGYTYQFLKQTGKKNLKVRISETNYQQGLCAHCVVVDTLEAAIVKQTELEMRGNKEVGIIEVVGKAV